MTNNNNKDILLRIFADNTVGNITAETLRKFISDIFDDKEVIINKYSTLSKFEEQDNPLIYEGSLVSIFDSTPEENGIYISQINQPKERKFLTQISNNVSAINTIEKNYEYKASQNQNIFACNYSDDLATVYVNGLKIRKSQVITNTGTSITLLTPLNKDDEVEIVTLIKE